MDDKEVIVQDIPYILWIFGAGFFGTGVFLIFFHAAPWLMAGIFILIGALVVVFVPLVTVRYDRSSRTVVIEKLGLTGLRRQEIPASQISRVEVQESSGSDSGPTFRVALRLQDGKDVALRTAYSSGRRGKEKQAEAIRQAVGIEAEVGIPMSAAQALGQVFQQAAVEDLEAQTGITPGEHETDGIRWTLTMHHFGGVGEGSQVYRWSSTDFDTPDFFVFLAQRMEGQGKQSGLMNLAGNLLFKQSLKMYGFNAYYTPGLDQAKTIEDIDRRLVEAFFVHTSDPVQARRLLNPWTVMPLVGWADRYALERRSRQFHQLTVLFSPLGVYVSVLNSLDRAQVDELVSLGVELVRSQGR